MKARLFILTVFTYTAARGDEKNISAEGYLIAGIFTSQAEIDNSSVVKTGETPNGEMIYRALHPGDLKYVDINGDGIIDSRDAAMTHEAVLSEFIHHSSLFCKRWKVTGSSLTLESITGLQIRMMFRAAIQLPLNGAGKNPVRDDLLVENDNSKFKIHNYNGAGNHFKNGARPAKP
jgi:hypothetical protein